jgi:serine phosphatase RsbU (regulator of sigma subunit)
MTATSAPPRSRVGLSIKLYAAIAGAVALTLAASVVAWISFVELGQLQRQITRQRIPSISDSLRLARQSALIAATVPALVSASDESERNRAMADLSNQRQVIGQLVDRLASETSGDSSAPENDARMAEIRDASRQLSDMLDRLDQSVGRQLALKSQLDDRIDRAANLHRQLIELLTPLLDDATLYLVTGFRTLQEATPEPPERRFTEKTLLGYAAMTQLSIEGNLIGGLLAEAANIPDVALLQPLSERFEAASDRFLQSIDAAGLADQQSLRGVATALIALGEGTDGIIEPRRQLLLEQHSANALVEQARTLATVLTGHVDRLVQSVQARMQEAVTASNHAIDVGETLLLVLNAVSILGAVLIGWGYVARHLTAPIVQITSAAAAFEAARFDAASLAAVRQRTDELGDLARTFTAMAAEVQSRADTLDRLVAERTHELNDKNAALEQSKQRVEAELEIARSLQLAMLPQDLPKNAGYTGKAAMVPAREMGGDFYDFFPIGDERLGLVIADVSGKGVPAAFFMAISRTILQGSARERRTPGQCLAAANELLCQQNPLDLFVTVFYGILDIETGELRYANGGHNPPLLARTDGTVASLPGTGGMAMGVMRGLTYKEDSVTLTPGDTLLLYTDGISEAMDRDGREFTEARLVNSMSESHRQSVEVVVSTVIDAVRNFVGDAPQSDDITCLVVRYKGPPEHAEQRDAAE